ncbi:hypothetical protein HMPREF0766_14458 [Sphingobacterium spiritivorum ATCC 33861]|uniref:Uncharacterized protein n=1 Tax=Sphingobacterium spiritivorum ATCC 33861 TaxID=525373 RepID=D7VTY8_SPHSI|nr:hypothetical protein HMPREF0766_14458 [Sphingobacterium spiritivorum ATCC 33861]
MQEGRFQQLDKLTEKYKNVFFLYSRSLLLNSKLQAFLKQTKPLNE